MGRIIALLYGMAAYFIFLVTFVYTIGFVSDFFVAKTIETGPDTSLIEAVVIDLGLMAVFAFQHSVMARPRFKAWWTRFVPSSVERSTYVLLSSLALILLFWQWRPISVVVWDLQDSNLAIALTGISLAGWLIVLSSTFLLDHFELFGLHQVAKNLAGSSMPTPTFRTPAFYKVVRHPIYLGFIIAFWATPSMTAGHLWFAVAMTIYIVVAIRLEERDLVELFGDDYGSYKERVSMLLPWRKSPSIGGAKGVS